MDHVVIPLGRDHRRALEPLAAGAAAAAGIPHSPGDPAAHVTLVAYRGLARPAALSGLEAVVSATRPLLVRAHGYGFFTGDRSSALSLHVQVVRSAALTALHRAVWDALAAGGAENATWSAPDLWSPHITLLDRCMDPARLGAAAAWLGRRHHPSWRILVDRVVLTGGWPEHGRAREAVLLLGTGLREGAPDHSPGERCQPPG